MSWKIASSKVWSTQYFSTNWTQIHPLNLSSSASLLVWFLCVMAHHPLCAALIPVNGRWAMRSRKPAHWTVHGCWKTSGSLDSGLDWVAATAKGAQLFPISCYWIGSSALLHPLPQKSRQFQTAGGREEAGERKQARKRKLETKEERGRERVGCLPISFVSLLRAWRKTGTSLRQPRLRCCGKPKTASTCFEAKAELQGQAWDLQRLLFNAKTLPPGQAWNCWHLFSRQECTTGTRLRLPAPPCLPTNDEGLHPQVVLDLLATDVIPYKQTLSREFTLQRVCQCSCCGPGQFLFEDNFSQKF